jgi:hypothetical protein
VTALAPAAAQRGGADAVVLRPEPVVEREQLGGLLRRHLGAPAAGLPGLLRKLAQGDVPPGRHRGDAGGDPGPLGDGVAVGLLRRLPPLHHVQHDLFQVGLAAAKRGDLRLQVLQLAR